MTHRTSPAPEGPESPGGPTGPQDEARSGAQQEKTPQDGSSVQKGDRSGGVGVEGSGRDAGGSGGGSVADRKPARAAKEPAGPARRSAVTAGTLPAVGRRARVSAQAGSGTGGSGGTDGPGGPGGSAGSGDAGGSGPGGRGGPGARDAASVHGAGAAAGAGSSGRRGALLGLLSAGAVVAAGGAVAAYSARRSGGQGASLGGGQGGGGAVASTGRTVEATVTVRGMRFVPDTVDVSAGDRLVITVDNTSDMVHDLVLETGATTGRIAAGQSATLDAGTVTAATEGWCSIAGHRAQGMVFHITVGAAATPGGPGHEQDHGETSQAPSSSGQETGETPDAVPDYEAELPEGFTAFDATLPAASRSPSGPTTHRHTFTVTEKVMEVGGGVTQTRMTFNGQVPGPVLRGSVGDVFEITLVNEGTMSHSIDFHAGITPPDDAMRSISPGESLVYTFTAQHSGIWLYHCSTAPMSLHLASGMHGAVIIDPPGLEAVDRELVIIQSELYLGPEAGETSYAKVQARTPDLMAFNGVAFQYSQQPLRARAGQRLRFWVLDAGPSLPSSFHIVGLQFDQVFLEGAWTLGGPGQIGSQWSGGSQALGLHPAQGGFVECVPAEPGHYVFVTHSFADMEKGARGVLHVTA